MASLFDNIKTIADKSLGKNEGGFLSGAFKGAGSGFLIGTAFGVAPAGAAIGAIYGGVQGSDNQQKKIFQNAADDAEQLRRESIVKQFGAKQQADSLALAGLKNGNKASQISSSANPNAAPGVIGSNITSSGTF